MEQVRLMETKPRQQEIEYSTLSPKNSRVLETEKETGLFHARMQERITQEEQPVGVVLQAKKPESNPEAVTVKTGRVFHVTEYNKAESERSDLSEEEEEHIASFDRFSQPPFVPEIGFPKDFCIEIPKTSGVASVRLGRQKRCPLLRTWNLDEPCIARIKTLPKTNNEQIKTT